MINHLDPVILDMGNKQKLKIDSAAVALMLHFRQMESETPESGGIMMGRILEENSSPMIDEITVPMEGDIQSRTRFLRQAEHHQQIFTLKWEENEGRLFYLGEWHTHPERVPTPSSTDTKNWRKIFLSSNQSIDYLLFVIVGTECLKVWKVGKKPREKVKITLVGKILFK
ncbi:Mov34/MPN/PAD-1 family protein [Paenibacillus sp. LS1]|uniref:Mov34/MPN/PAD-1 family protein n=1 Tax=Paenibacillus sp. LS1 TaxID=2992120 RepID=UPI002231583C|nr:Mov34/MPN/PAD-1 family protein [Paenibacillus sp. LS1]MCW3794470.1 Mov34/MPN/PAD-1 family protein [Paenibacillus sp. LS1]